MVSKRSSPTVLHCFLDSLETRPDETAIHVVESQDETIALSYTDLYRLARWVAKGLKERNLEPADRLIIAIPTSQEFFSVYFGALLSGVVPLMVPAPRVGRALSSYLEQVETTASGIGAKYVVVSEESQEQLAGLSSLTCITVPSLCESGAISSFDFVPNELDIAHLQATSGTTGAPKYAVIRHRNIAANVKGIGLGIQHRAGDSLVTWLPMFHDMGLVGISYALFWRCPLIATDPSKFVRNPIFWLDVLTRFSGTLSPAPNSAYQACARLASRRRYDDLDLSAWRVALCGAEPVHEDTILEFAQAFGPFGFRETAMLPVYGLAEATLAATIPDVNAIPHIESVDAELMETDGRCLASGSDSKRHLRMVSVGAAIEGHSVRIVNHEGTALGEREIGEIEFAGPSVIDGYWGNPPGQDHPNGVLRTGDLGYLADGQLYVTGRQKDVIIINGRNLAPTQIEAIVYKAIGDVGRGVVAWGSVDSTAKTESLHIMIESRVLRPAERSILEDSVSSALEDVFGLGGVTVHWVKKGKIPKTTSGKVRRHSCRELVRSSLPRMEGAERPGSRAAAVQDFEQTGEPQ